MSAEDGRTGRPSIVWSWDIFWGELERAGVCFPDPGKRDRWLPEPWGEKVMEAAQQLQDSGRLTTAQIEAVAYLCWCVSKAAQGAEPMVCNRELPS